MTPEKLEKLHAEAFVTPAPWSADDFRSLLSDPQVQLLARDGGFILLRVVADEAEILTLAVAPALRRNGIGSSLVVDGLHAAGASGAKAVFLEVAAPNGAARSLYAKLGFEEVGTRHEYYRAPDGRRQDALILRRAL